MLYRLVRPLNTALSFKYISTLHRLELILLSCMTRAWFREQIANLQQSQQ